MDMVARVCIVLMGILYLGGQLFFGAFSVIATVTGLSGIFAAVLWQRRWRHQQNIALGVALLATITLAGFILEAYEYYRYFDGPGNDFAWEFRAPYLAAVLWLFFDSSRKLNMLRRST